MKGAAIKNKWTFSFVAMGIVLVAIIEMIFTM